MPEAKRVILRLAETDMNYLDPYEPVRLYLEKTNQSLQDLDDNHHFIHIQPPNPEIPQVKPKIHVVIDFEKEKFAGSTLKGHPDFPHEFYRLHRDGDELVIAYYPETTWLENFMKKLREIMDDAYPWGSAKRTA